MQPHLPRPGARLRRHKLLPRLAVAATIGVLVAATTPASTATATNPAPEPAVLAAEAVEYRVIGPQTFDDVDAVAATGAAVDDVDDGKVYVTANAAEVEAIRALGFEVEALPPLLYTHTTGQDYPPGYDGYHTFDQLVEVVDQVVADHPTIAARYSIGTSYEGRDLIAVKISDNVAQEQGQPEVLFNAGQHAREHLTVEMAIHLLRMFTEEYGSDPRVTEIVDSRVIWILPNVNPDGAEYDIATGSFRSWRKNRQPNQGSTAVGADPGRVRRLPVAGDRDGVGLLRRMRYRRGADRAAAPASVTPSQGRDGGVNVATAPPSRNGSAVLTGASGNTSWMASTAWSVRNTSTPPTEMVDPSTSIRA